MKRKAGDAPSADVWTLLREADEKKSTWSAQAWCQWFVQLVDAQPRATGEGARDEQRAMVSVQSPVDRSGSASDSASAAVAGDRAALARDEAGQTLPLQQLRGSPENAADAAPVAVSLGLPEALAAFIDVYGVVFDEDDEVMLQAVLARLRGEATVRPEVNRFEVIGDTGRPAEDGRLLTFRDVQVELSYQDDGRTLKVFLKRAPATVRVEE
jgi:hypothetical protein